MRDAEDFDCPGYACPDCARNGRCPRTRSRFVGICDGCGKWIFWSGPDGNVSGYSWTPETNAVTCGSCVLK